MRISFLTTMAVALVAMLASVMPAQADCKQDVADAFAKQRETAAFRMKTRQLSARGIIFMTVDYLLPYKMHQTVRSATGTDKSELILVGTRAWHNSGLGWVQMSDADTLALNKQFGASVIDPPKDKLDYECLGQVDVDGRTLLAYQGKQGGSDSAKTETVILRTIYIDPKTELPVRSIVARASKPDLAFFKADYTYPKDIVIEPPKDAKPAPTSDGAKEDTPNQSKKP